MRKIFWAGGIFLGAVVVVIVVLSVAVRSYLKSDRLKALIIPKIEEFTGRKAGMDRIDVSLFKGIAVKGISLMEQDGKQEFVSVKEFVLEYRLLPLLKKRLVIKKVELVSPSFRLVREKDGRFNFDDIIERSREAKQVAGSKEAKEEGLPLSVETDHISVRDSRMTFTDAEGAVPDLSLDSDIDLKLSAEKGGSPEVTGKVSVKGLTIKGEGGQVTGAGSVVIGKDSADFNLTAVIGKDTVKLSGDVKDYMKKAVARVDLSAAELDLESLIAFSAAKKGTPKPLPLKQQAPPLREKGKGERTAGLAASGELKVGTAKYKGYILKDLAARYNYSENNVIISPLSTGLSGGKEAIVQGAAKGDLKFSVAGENHAQGVTETVKKTLEGKLSIDLSRCEIKETKISSAVAAFTGIREAANPKFDAVHFLLTLGSGKMTVDGTMTSGLMNANPAGTVGLDGRMDITADLKVAPSLAGRLVSGQFTRLITDERGWTVIPLRITGTTDKPSVGLNQAAVNKQVEKGVKQEIEKRLFKGIFGK